MTKSLHTRIYRVTRDYIRTLLNLLKNSLVPIKNFLLSHKLPAFTIGSLLLLSTPMGIAHFRNDPMQQSLAHDESQFGIAGSSTLGSNSEYDRLRSSRSTENDGPNSSNASNTDISGSQSTSQQSYAAPQLTINGQNVPIPNNGSVHKNVQSNNQSVDVRVNNSSSSTNQSGSSLNIQIQSHSTSTGTDTDSDDDSSASTSSRDRLLTPKDRGY